MLDSTTFWERENRRRTFIGRIEVARERGRHWEPKVSAIVDEVCAQRGVTIAEIRSLRRAQRIVRARHEIMYRALEETSLSFSQIGRAIHKDHSTVVNGYRKHIERAGGILPKSRPSATRRPRKSVMPDVGIANVTG